MKPKDIKWENAKAVGISSPPDPKIKALVDDFFSHAPKYRTKERLIKMISRLMKGERYV